MKVSQTTPKIPAFFLCVMVAPFFESRIGARTAPKNLPSCTTLEKFQQSAWNRQVDDGSSLDPLGDREPLMYYLDPPNGRPIFEGSGFLGERILHKSSVDVFDVIYDKYV